MVHIIRLLLLLLSAAYNGHASSDPSTSLPSSPPTFSTCVYNSDDSFESFSEEGEEWRKYLPLKLRHRKGAPLHRVILESRSNPGSQVTLYLLGTSHVSRSSCEDAKVLMEYARPDVLFVELCSQRVGILLDTHLDSNEQSESTKDQIEQSSAGMTPTSQKMSILFTKIQSDYAKKLNVTIGGEFRSAFQSALLQQKEFWHKESSKKWYEQRDDLVESNKNHPMTAHQYSPQSSLQHLRGTRPCAIILGDRPVRITLARAWESLRLFGKLKLVLCLVWSSIRQPSEKELKEWMESILNDRTGKSDLMTKAMDELGKAFPSLKRVIIEERDNYMTAKLRQTAEMLVCMGKDEREEKVIVAVVGAGHCNGMMAKLMNGDKTDAPEEILQTLVETNWRKLNNDEEVLSLVTDIVQVDYEYALQYGAL
ncbi:hypothetical protein HJC23_001546 [Cyclotella cryptica]|uniref:TraB domain-containing protein n=1 Tax=Cyclotella cryptica TaxID=29204 RepID=A0ABD3PW35_9STRA|eukprot:CCRYP_010757-RA/>CCRYP_010757-RA protein AED:0.30 eAED:0.30 QI:206/1/1/1/0.5/0.33/3/470/423